MSPDDLRQGSGIERYLQRTQPIVLHCAANLSFRPTATAEPWRSNVEGTAALLDLCRRSGLSQLHLISTAFVCGRRQGRIDEEDLERGQEFHNSYEQSKFEAERLVRRAGPITATIYRPAIIVGDSQTGRTPTFTGLYRFLELAHRLAERPGADGRRRLPLRLPLSGDSPCHLVCVDWVSRAIIGLLDRPQWHGRTFHLTGTAPVPARLIRDVAVEVFGFDGVQMVGPHGWNNSSHLEETFWEGVQEYWPYLAGTPAFTDYHLRAALPHLPAPVIDRLLLGRLFRFAANEWRVVSGGWREPKCQVLSTQYPVLSTQYSVSATPPDAPRPSSPTTHHPPPIADYIERIFPHQARKSALARTAGLDLVVSFDIQGSGGGQWSCEWSAGELHQVGRGLSDRARVVYRLDVTTFAAIVAGRLSPQQAFFERAIEVTGDLETALKLAVLFDWFLKESPGERCADMEVTHESSHRPPALHC